MNSSLTVDDVGRALALYHAKGSTEPRAVLRRLFRKAAKKTGVRFPHNLSAVAREPRRVAYLVTAIKTPADKKPRDRKGPTVPPVMIAVGRREFLIDGRRRILAASQAGTPSLEVLVLR